MSFISYFRFMIIVIFPFCGLKLVEAGSVLLGERCLLLTESSSGQKTVTVTSISCWTGGLRWERLTKHSGRKWTLGGLLWKNPCMPPVIKNQNKTTLALEDLLWACRLQPLYKTAGDEGMRLTMYNLYSWCWVFKKSLVIINPTISN